MKKKKNENITPYLAIPFAFILGFALGILYYALSPNLQKSEYIEIREKGYEYINPLIDFETLQPTNREKIKDIERAIESYITERKQDKDITHISVYYKDLTTGAWIGVNEKEDFIPASLNKVPLMMALYKKEMKNPGFLQQKLTYQYSESFNGLYQQIEPIIYLEDGEDYTIDELINQIIVYSDNSILELLYSTLSNQEGQEIFDDLGVTNPYTYGTFEDSMSVKEYASSLRILYNASYLSKDLSSKALQLLRETSFDKGLKAGVPSDIKVANKFGERGMTNKDSEEIYQKHDCGIIYYNPNPYILCVMTRGADPKKLTESINKISAIVYKKVSK